MKRAIRPIRVDGDVAYVTLTRGLVATLDAADVPIVAGRNWYALVTPYGHAYGMAAEVRDGKSTSFLMHRVIMAASPGEEVDHIDGDGLNNRRSNLRLCSHQQNMANQVTHRHNRLGLKGAQKHRGRYRATITFCGKKHNLGAYPTAEEAAAAYRGAAMALNGEYAKKDRPDPI